MKVTKYSNYTNPFIQIAAALLSEMKRQYRHHAPDIFFGSDEKLK